MIFMDKDEFLLKRIRELANLSYQRDIVTFTDFLNLNEQNMLVSLKLHQIGVEVKLFGGYEHAERQMAAFFPGGLGFSWDYPIDCLKIEPKALRFSEELGHRDYLGALLNLGVDRSVVGDILIKAVELLVNRLTAYQIHETVSQGDGCQTYDCQRTEQHNMYIVVQQDNTNQQDCYGCSKYHHRHPYTRL